MRYNLEKFNTYRPAWTLDTIFDDFFTPNGRSLEQTSEHSFAPVCNIEEDKDQYLLLVDLPGVKKEDVHVELESDRLTVSGERHVETKSEDKSYHLQEVSHGRFSRSFKLAEGIDESKIEAKYQDGVLSLKLPKSSLKKTKQIKIS